jgi:hypothetical protein
VKCAQDILIYRASVVKTERKFRKKLPIVGWREWVGLPELGCRRIKAKVDTGAKTSALHAFNIEEFERSGEAWVRFDIHPRQRAEEPVVSAEAKVLEYRIVRSSNGKESRRPVILTNLHWRDKKWPIELTLANRDSMGFRMLLGREAMRGRVLVDSESSFCGGKPVRSDQKRNQQ